MEPINEELRRKSNTLPTWGNMATMNLNSLILNNIQSSPYFKGRLSELQTYHEVVDEIYYKVNHLEPWEKGSRRIAGQTGMCGSVRGVGAGGIISTAFCLLYKLFAIRLTRKQVNGLLNHVDSPYIRSLGFMYVRFTQPPADLWEWFEPYIDDAEVRSVVGKKWYLENIFSTDTKKEVDVRAGGGQIITIGEMCRIFLTKLDWFSSLFPRIPVPIQIGIDKKLQALTQTEECQSNLAPQITLREDSSRRSSRNRSEDERHDRARSKDDRSSRSSSSRHKHSHRRSRSSSRDYRSKEDRRSSSHYSSSSSSRRKRSRSPYRHERHSSSRHGSDKHSSSRHRSDHRDRR